MSELFIGSDHGGFELKQSLLEQFARQKISVIDIGAHQLHEDDDYPLYAGILAEKVGQKELCLGILICRSGQGMAIVANKFPGIRAAVAWTEGVAAAGRADDAINILCLPADYVTSDKAWKIVQTWLKTQVKTEEKYLRRIREIKQIEAKIKQSIRS